VKRTCLLLQYRIGGEMKRTAFGAQPAKIGRMIRIAPHASDPLPVGFNDDAAADTAITTCGFGFHSI
jgi:hypothetical protein